MNKKYENIIIDATNVTMLRHILFIYTHSIFKDDAASLSKSFTDFKDEVKAFCRAILDDTKSKLIISNEVIAQDSNIADAPFVVYKLGTDEARIYFHQNFKFEIFMFNIIRDIIILVII